MKTFKITLSKSASKEFSDLDAVTAKRVIVSIENLKLNPKPNECIKIKGNSNLWRLRVGVYRIIYSIDNEMCIVDIKTIRHRKDVYNKI